MKELTNEAANELGAAIRIIFEAPKPVRDIHTHLFLNGYGANSPTDLRVGYDGKHLEQVVALIDGGLANLGYGAKAVEGRYNITIMRRAV